MSVRRPLLVVFGLVTFLAIAARSQSDRAGADSENEAPAHWPDDRPVDAGTRPTAMFGRNLLVNGNAEADLFNPGPTWSVNGPVTVAVYGTSAGEPDEKSPGPTDRGRRYFRCPVLGGGPRPAYAITQTVDVVAVTAMIDAGKVHYRLEGWFGGTGDADAYLKLIFRNGDGRELGTVHTDAVAKTHSRASGALTERAKQGQIPMGTRRISVVLQFYNPGAEFSDAVGSADSLSLMLTK